MVVKIYEIFRDAGLPLDGASDRGLPGSPCECIFAADNLLLVENTARNFRASIQGAFVGRSPH